MGQRRRVISQDRIGINKEAKIKIVIAVEGKNNKTESLYFKNFENRYSPFSITIASGNDTDPVKLVKSLEKAIKTRGVDLTQGDMAYVIFDTDTNPNKNKSIAEARKYASKIGIKVITSAPCFELWLLLHYVFTSSFMDNKEVYNALKQYCSKYTKNYNIFSDIFPNVNEAIKNAKRLEQEHIRNGCKIGNVEANPNTEVYKIVECLMNYNNNK